jgi:hypothetical protein
MSSSASTVSGFGRGSTTLTVRRYRSRWNDSVPPSCRLCVEREANVFGAELLMPVAAVRKAWAAFPDAAEVAARFEVSALAAQWRSHSFGLTERPS